MDSDAVLDFLDSLWFFANVITSPYDVSSSRSTSDAAEEKTETNKDRLNQLTSPVSQELEDMVGSWMDDAVKAVENDDDDEELEQSTLIAMVMSGTAVDAEELPPPVTNPNQIVNNKSKKNSKNKKKVMSVKNVLIERRRNDLEQQVEFDSFHGFRRGYNNSYNPDEFYGPWFRKQQTVTGLCLREPLRSWNLTVAN